MARGLMVSNHAVDCSAKSLRRVVILIGLGILAAFAVPVVTFLVWTQQHLREIESLDKAAHALRGKASVPPGSSGIWEWDVPVALQLHDPGVDDAAFTRLANMRAFRFVQFLNVGGTRITDKSLELLKQSPKLVLLDLSRTHVTDKGLESVVKLRFVSSLYLDGTDVTDAGIDVLTKNRGPRNLFHIDLSNTKVTCDAEKQLSKAFDTLKITHLAVTLPSGNEHE